MIASGDMQGKQQRQLENQNDNYHSSCPDFHTAKILQCEPSSTETILAIKLVSKKASESK